MGAAVGRCGLFCGAYAAARLRAPTDDETIWRLLRRFKILVFDFESPGSDYDFRVREQGRALLALDQAHRAADLWAVLTDAALACDAAGGGMDRPSLVRELEQIHGFRFGDRPDLRAAHDYLCAAIVAYVIQCHLVFLHELDEALACPHRRLPGLAFEARVNAYALVQISAQDVRLCGVMTAHVQGGRIAASYALSNTFRTDDAYHCPPRGVVMPLAFRASAI